MARHLERALFASRWLMAPFYVGLIGALLALMIKFVQELAHLLPHALDLAEKDLILITLTLVDLTLVASLVLMVIFSGYENFVSRLDLAGERRLEWMGTLDYGGLKLKLAASIVAISGIHLLKSFMNIGSVSRDELMWLTMVHLAFVLSGLLLAVMDYVTARGKKLAKEA